MMTNFGWHTRLDTSGDCRCKNCVFASKDNDMGATVYYCQVKRKECNSTLCQNCKVYKSMYQLIKEARLKEEAGDDIDGGLDW